MKHIISFVAVALLCAFSMQSSAQQSSYQCKYDYVTYCEEVVQITVPCNWMGDLELLFFIEDDVNTYVCG